MILKRNYGIIIACDVDSLSTLSSLVAMSCNDESVVGYKVGFSLSLRFGLKKVTETVRELTDLPVMYDHQKAGTDIPQMAELFARCCSESGISGVIVFPQAGPETLCAFVKAIIGSTMMPIVGGMMTHPRYLQSDGGFIVNEAPSAIYREALNLGATHFVLPGNQPEQVRRYATELLSRGPDAMSLSLLMPGIGSQGGQIKQAFDAAGGHRCYAIVGSAIYNASDPQGALREFADQIKSYVQPAKPKEPI